MTRLAQHENPWFNNLTAREAVYTVLELMKAWLEQQMTPAMAVIRSWNDEVHHYAIDGPLLEDWHSKNQVAAKMVRELFEKQGKWMIFASDTWMAKAGKAGDDGSLPDVSKMPKNLADWPEDMRSEALMLACNAIGEEGFVVIVPYHREPSGIVWDTIDWETAGRTAHISRFIFDLRTRRVKDALKQAYATDREGRRKATVH